jgi:putative transposase
MPRRARTRHEPHYFHVINRSSRRTPMFVRPKDYRDFMAILREGLKKHPVPLVAYCVLNNHWHLVTGPTGTKRISKLLHWVTTTHAVRLQLRRGTRGEGPVYQGRFKSHALESSGSVLKVIRYVERNALSAQLVRRAEDWPWGSLADRLRSDPAVPLMPVPMLTSQSWIEYVNASHHMDQVPERPVPWLWKAVENRPVPSDDVAERPGAGGGKRGQQGIAMRRRAGEDEADAHVEGAKHLRLVELPRRAKPAEQRRNRPAVSVK